MLMKFSAVVFFSSLLKCLRKVFPEITNHKLRMRTHAVCTVCSSKKINSNKVINLQDEISIVKLVRKFSVHAGRLKTKVSQVRIFCFL